jgi:tripartite-type tricarboxylate transporter receptor subunit TctC
VGYAAGGTVDTTARIFAPKLSADLGQQVIVENRAGAASNIAADYVAKAPPDGYTLFWSSGTGLGTNLAFYQKMTYNPLKDFAPIALLMYQSNGLVVNPTVAATTTKELIALAKARPGQLNYGPAGISPDVVARLNAVANKALQDPDVKNRLVDLGLGIAGSTPEQLGAHMREQSALMIRIAKDAGIKPLD